MYSLEDISPALREYLPLKGRMPYEGLTPLDTNYVFVRDDRARHRASTSVADGYVAKLRTRYEREGSTVEYYPDGGTLRGSKLLPSVACLHVQHVLVMAIEVYNSSRAHDRWVTAIHADLALNQPVPAFLEASGGLLAECLRDRVEKSSHEVTHGLATGYLTVGVEVIGVWVVPSHAVTRYSGASVLGLPRVAQHQAYDNAPVDEYRAAIRGAAGAQTLAQVRNVNAVCNLIRLGSFVASADIMSRRGSSAYLGDVEIAVDRLLTGVDLRAYHTHDTVETAVHSLREAFTQLLQTIGRN